MPLQGRRDRKRQNLNKIADSAFSLFEENGYEDVTMEQIANQADIAKGTLYNHFPDKESVIAFWIERKLAADIDGISQTILKMPSIRSQLQLLFAASAEWCEKHRHYLYPYIRHRFLKVDSTGDRDGMTAFNTKLLEAAQQRDELNDALSAAQLSTYLNYIYLAALMRWLQHPETVLRGEFDTAISLFINGTGKNSAIVPS